MVLLKICFLLFFYCFINCFDNSQCDRDGDGIYDLYDKKLFSIVAEQIGRFSYYELCSGNPHTISISTSDIISNYNDSLVVRFDSDSALLQLKCEDNCVLINEPGYDLLLVDTGPIEEPYEIRFTNDKNIYTDWVLVDRIIDNDSTITCPNLERRSYGLDLDNVDFSFFNFPNTIIISFIEVRRYNGNSPELDYLQVFHYAYDYDNDLIININTDISCINDSIPIDNCPTIPNSNQIDSNLNGIGDECEYSILSSNTISNTISDTISKSIASLTSSSTSNRKTSPSSTSESFSTNNGLQLLLRIIIMVVFVIFLLVVICVMIIVIQVFCLRIIKVVKNKKEETQYEKLEKKLANDFD